MCCVTKLLCLSLLVFTVWALCINAFAADYDFGSYSGNSFYSATSYEDVHGAKYIYGGVNLSGICSDELPYGNYSSTQTGVMDTLSPPYLLKAGGVPMNSYFGLAEEFESDPVVAVPPAYTSPVDMVYEDGSIGTVAIPALNISMKVWEGETNTSMAKGLGRYSTTSAWNGNVGVCGHNRGAKYVIGGIKDLENGDLISYTTIFGTRTYEVVMVRTISSTDWSYLQATADNRITITTCLADQPDKRICVQAVEVKR